MTPRLTQGTTYTNEPWNASSTTIGVAKLSKPKESLPKTSLTLYSEGTY